MRRRPTISVSLSPLAACLAVALCSLPADAHPLRAQASARAASLAFHAAPRGGMMLPVTSCLDDSSGGTLREVLASAGEGDTVDMSALACSTITLAQGELATALDDINLAGPSDHELTIDAAAASRVISHTGTGMLRLSHLGISNGHLAGSAGNGACVRSTGSVEAGHVNIANCNNLTQVANGGGLFATDSVTITDSSITNNHTAFQGGGVMAVTGTMTIVRSTLSGNSALGCAGAYTYSGAMSVVGSTISGNTATAANSGGVCAYSGLDIVNSTISGNHALGSGGGVRFDGEATIRNSTIAFNSAGNGGGIAGHFGSTLTMTSSIVASNNAGSGTSDIGNVTTVNGSHNLVMATNVPMPPDTITGSPGIGPLADNGGPTRTHALLPGSIAIDAGDNPDALASDQRGFARNRGAATDIGAYEVQSDVIFADGFELPGTHR